jgi:hypothetical protein
VDRYLPGGVVGTDIVFIGGWQAGTARVFAEVEERGSHDGEIAYDEGNAALHASGSLSLPHA